jgi:hypothetical protein
VRLLGVGALLVAAFVAAFALTSRSSDVAAPEDHAQAPTPAAVAPLHRVPPLPAVAGADGAARASRDAALRARDAHRAATAALRRAEARQREAAKPRVVSRPPAMTVVSPPPARTSPAPPARSAPVTTRQRKRPAKTFDDAGDFESER